MDETEKESLNLLWYLAWHGVRTQADFVRLDQDILTPLAGKKKLYTFETADFWEQIKTPG